MYTDNTAAVKAVTDGDQSYTEQSQTAKDEEISKPMPKTWSTAKITSEPSDIAKMKQYIAEFEAELVQRRAALIPCYQSLERNPDYEVSSRYILEGTMLVLEYRNEFTETVIMAAKRITIRAEKAKAISDKPELMPNATVMHKSRCCSRSWLRSIFESGHSSHFWERFNADSLHSARAR